MTKRTDVWRDGQHCPFSFGIATPHLTERPHLSQKVLTTVDRFTRAIYVVVTSVKNTWTLGFHPSTYRGHCQKKWVKTPQQTMCVQLMTKFGWFSRSIAQNHMKRSIWASAMPYSVLHAIQGCSEKTDTFVLLPTSLFMVQQLRNGDQMKARENAICASTNPSCRKVSCISLQHMFQMGAFSHHAQLCSLAHFLDHVAAHFWRDRLNGTGDGLLQLWNILGVVFEYSILQVPPKKKSQEVSSREILGATHGWSSLR